MESTMAAKKATTKAPKVADADSNDDGLDLDTGDSPTYTYIGGGETSPHRIHFMGKQHFIRGKETAVTNPEVLAKVKNNPAFVEGGIELEELDDADNEAADAADEQRKYNRQLDAAIKKQYGKE